MELWVPTLLGSGLLVTVANHLLAHRRESALRARDAVAEIRHVLRGLARLVRQRGTVEIDGHDLAAAFRECEETIRTLAPALGGNWRHLVRSVRAAVGEDSGMPSWADLDWSEHVAEISPVDRRWWQYAVEYLDYVDSRLGLVAIGGTQVSRVELIDYDTWLRRTVRFMGVGVETSLPSTSVAVTSGAAVEFCSAHVCGGTTFRVMVRSRQASSGPSLGQPELGALVHPSS